MLGANRAAMPRLYRGQSSQRRGGSEIAAYLEQIDATLAPSHGRFLIHGGEKAVLEGTWPGDLIVIAFQRLSAHLWRCASITPRATEERRVFPELTVQENLEVGRQAAREEAPAWTPERLFALFPNLALVRARPAGRTSGGEQQMLTIARTLMGNPRGILLDEPSEGLAPVIVEQMAATILELKQGGLAILLSEQNLRFAQAIADRALIMETGRIRYRGTMAELAADEEVRTTYLTV
jgi:ABC-type branched-subunit amino acid transport system ATPase component